ncbi:MAG: hypothetical protein QOE34_2405, partial [Verrucomicrobiota bacterium]
KAEMLGTRVKRLSKPPDDETDDD